VLVAQRVLVAQTVVQTVVPKVVPKEVAQVKVMGQVLVGNQLL
jgi:hypothetical protein